MVAFKQAKLPSKVPATLRRAIENRAQALAGAGADYLALAMDLINTLQPEDAIEGILVKQAMDHAWYVAVLRQIETALLASKHAAPPGHSSLDDQAMDQVMRAAAAMKSHDVIQGIVPGEGENYSSLKERFAPEMRRMEEEELRKSREAYAKRKQQTPVVLTTTADDLAAAYLRNSPDLERLSRQIALSESRFSACLKELDRYREARRSAQERGQSRAILDAEFTEVATPEIRHDYPTQASGQPAQRSRQHRSSNRTRQGEGQPERSEARPRHTDPAPPGPRSGSAHPRKSNSR